MTDSLNGKERKELAKWIFLAMSSHDTIKPYSKITQSDIDESNKYMASLVTRLMTEDCPKQVKEAYKISGAKAIENAFGIVGEVAMQELMNDPKVGAAFDEYGKYIDEQKFNSIF